jgi:putative flippase GtrA
LTPVLTAATIRRLFFFGLSGTAGFVVDSAVLVLCLRVFGLGPHVGRVISFAVAMTCTWQLNRRFTFRSTAPPLPEFARFVATNSLGALVNLGAYTAVIARFGTADPVPVLGVAAGSLCGMVVNYILSSWLVFRRHHAVDITQSR